MSFTYPRSHWEVVQAIKSALEAVGWIADPSSAGLPAFGGAPLNGSPEATPVRDCKNKPKYPRLDFFFSTPNPGMIVEENVIEIVEVTTAEAPYIEAEPAALADGQTLQITRGYNNSGVYAKQTLTATFLTADFADIANPTAQEIADVLDALAGVSASVVSGKVRVLHDDTGGKSSLQVTGGTAAALKSNFPDYAAFGRNVGHERRDKGPARFYHYPFRLSLSVENSSQQFRFATEMDGLFKTRNMGRERSLEINTRPFQLDVGEPVESPDFDTGIVAVQYLFELRNVPILTTAADFDSDNYSGGNWWGEGATHQLPVIPSTGFSLTLTRGD